MAGEAAIRMSANARAASKKASALQSKLKSVFHLPMRICLDLQVQDIGSKGRCKMIEVGSGREQNGGRGGSVATGTGTF